MIKIKKLEIENFKSLKNATVDAFGDVNLFYGFNNSGKSNVFKFLELLFKPKELRETVDVKNEAPSGRESTNIETLISYTPYYDGNIYDQPFLFFKNERKNSIKFIITLLVSNEILPEKEKLKSGGYLGEDVSEIVLEGTVTSTSISESYLQIQSGKINGKLFYQILDGIAYYFEKGATVGRKESDIILGLFSDLVTYIDTDRNFITEILLEGNSNFDSKNFKNWLFDLNIDSDKFEIFNQLINFISNFKFSDDAKNKLSGNLSSFPFSENTQISFAKFGQEIEVMLNNSDGRFPLKNYGTGVQQLFFILTNIFSSKAKVIIIEEMELNLSQIYQLEILKFLKSLMGQKFDQLLLSSHSPFFTTHGADLLDYIHYVAINSHGLEGTTVESHDDPKSLVDNDNPADNSFFSLLFS